MNHSFDVNFATEYKNVDIAILICHFQYWINMNKRLGRNLHENRTWTYQTLTEIAAMFPYWTKRQVEKYINKMVELKILTKGNFNKNSFDRTVWYAFVNESKFLYPENLEMEDLKEPPSGISPNGEIDKSKHHSSISPNGEIRFHQTVTPIPDILTNTLTDKESVYAHTREDSSKKELKEEKIAYRENVLLTEAQHKKLLDQYGEEKLEKMLDILDCKKGSKGYKYKSDYHTLTPTNWVHSEWSKQVLGPNPNKNASFSANADSESVEKNKKISEFAERKLGHMFNGHVFFQAGPKSAMLCHLHKDIKKEYIYENMKSDEYKEILLRDLDRAFPGAKGILMGSNQSSALGSLIGGLTQQMRLTV